MDFVEKTISDGISLVNVSANRFKTNEIAISLALPLKKETSKGNRRCTVLRKCSRDRI